MTRSPQFIRLASQIREKSCGTSDFRSTALLLVQALCEWFHCEWGAYWSYEERAMGLEAVVTWKEPNLSADKLLEDTLSRVLRENEGNAGQVWATGRAKCARDLVSDMCIPRSIDATEAGLVGGIWIPVRRGEIKLGVIELLGTHYWASSPEFLEQLEDLGSAIGEVFEKNENAGTRSAGK